MIIVHSILDVTQKHMQSRIATLKACELRKQWRNVYVFVAMMFF